jgi:shikimate dehydrogenase
MDICNRTLGRGEDIINDCPFPCSSSALSLLQAEQRMEEYDIIVQTTSVGMSPDTNSMPVQAARIKKGAFISDIIYNPLETNIIKAFRRMGGYGENGIGMFVHQGALAFELWTGIKPDSNRMRKIVQQQLGG